MLIYEASYHISRSRGIYSTFIPRMDPSAAEWGATCGMGLDATRPFGKRFPDVVTVSGLDRVPALQAKFVKQRNKQG